MNGTPSENAQTLLKVGAPRKTLLGLFPGHDLPVQEEPPREEEPPVLWAEPTRDPIQAIVDVMLKVVEDGGAADWYLIELFPKFETCHWAAYAALAKVPTPTPSVVRMIERAYAQRIGYEYLLDGKKA